MSDMFKQGNKKRANEVARPEQAIVVESNAIQASGDDLAVPQLQAKTQSLKEQNQDLRSQVNELTAASLGLLIIPLTRDFPDGLRHEERNSIQSTISPLVDRLLRQELQHLEECDETTLNEFTAS